MSECDTGDGHDRRAADRAEEAVIAQQQKKIDDLILLEDDPKQRLFLMVMSSINKSIHANTVITQATGEKLDAHIIKSGSRHKEFVAHTVEEAAMINKGRGMWLIIPGILAIAQLVGVFIFMDVRDDLRAIHSQLNGFSVMGAQFDERIKYLESKYK